MTETLPKGATVLATPGKAEGKLTTGFSYPYDEGSIQYYSLPMGTHNETEPGWEAMATAVPVRCFTQDPSIKSSLKFLRRTPWARKKVEELYLQQAHATFKSNFSSSDD